MGTVDGFVEVEDATADDGGDDGEVVYDDASYGAAHPTKH